MAQQNMELSSLERYYILFDAIAESDLNMIKKLFEARRFDLINDLINLRHDQRFLQHIPNRFVDWQVSIKDTEGYRE